MIMLYSSSSSAPNDVLMGRRKSTAPQKRPVGEVRMVANDQKNGPAEAPQATGGNGDKNDYPPGLSPGFFVVRQYQVPDNVSEDRLRLIASTSSGSGDRSVLDRLDLSSSNMTLPFALVLLDPQMYPSLSRARKACRKGSILVQRASHPVSLSLGSTTYTDSTTTSIGRVIDRVYPGDILARQVRMGSGSFPILSHKKPPFELPVVYEDDHFALVNKPAGVVVYSQRHGGHGIMTVRSALPFCLRPSAVGTYSVLRRPSAVHRLDKATSGILVIAKTKPSMLDLSRQFHDRIIRKTYMAIVNGIPDCLDGDGIEDRTVCRVISAREARDIGVDVDDNEDPIGEGTEKHDPCIWNLIDSPLEEKNAVTVWRSVHHARSLQTIKDDGYLTLVELKPKTGRFHQLRRHLAWICGRPIVGDAEYDGGSAAAMRFRNQGLFLCSTRIVLEHPYYNSPEGRAEWEAGTPSGLSKQGDSVTGSRVWLSEATGRVMVSATIDLPAKFERLLKHEEERYHKFHS